MRRTTRFLPFLILAAYFALSMQYALLTPPWQVPDEPAHYNYVRHVAQTRSLPELTMGCYDQTYLSRLTTGKFPPALSIAPICYEHYQPPLYYLLAAPLFAATGGSLLALRLFSAALGGVSLWMVYRTVSLFLPGTPIPPATMAFVAFVPMHLTMLAAANNDSLAELLFITFLFLLLRWLLGDAPHGAPLPLLAGGVLGLILLTKVTVYTAVPLAALILLAGDRRPRPLLKNALRLYLPALLMALPLYARNALLYGNGDVLGLRRHDAVVVGQLRTADYLAQRGLPAYLGDLLRTTFHSFWGQFGWMAVPMDGRVYLALNLLQGLALVGLGLWLWRGEGRRPAVRLSLGVLAAALALSAGVFAGLNLSFVQFQGRYFFSALMPLGVFFSLGMAHMLRRECALWGAGVSLAVLAVAALNGGLDKWSLLLGGGAAAAFLVRRGLPEEASGWL
ncbi:MAG: DUF2142 domain-containing protein, partial [Caldilineae bacterium]